MTHHNRILSSVALIATLCFFVPSLKAQVPMYYGPLMYGQAFDTAVPPVSGAMPPTIITDYMYFDEAMRLNSKPQLLRYINLMTWNDTAQWLASNLYQIQDYDPMSFENWSGRWVVGGDPYRCEPGAAKSIFLSRIKQLLGFRTWELLAADIIADVTVSDTICVVDPTAYLAKDMVLVQCSLLDEIKGKNIPACGGLEPKTLKKGLKPLRTPTSPIWAYTTPADTGTCLLFAYSPEWERSSPDNGQGTLKNSSGWWVKPSHEYIVFLNITGIGLDSTAGFFTVFPGGFGTSGGMYPVVGGIVQDPNDDFGFGSTHLTVSEWKADLRARINGIVTP